MCHAASSEFLPACMTRLIRARLRKLSRVEFKCLTAACIIQMLRRRKLGTSAPKKVVAQLRKDNRQLERDLSSTPSCYSNSGRKSSCISRGFWWRIATQIFGLSNPQPSPAANTFAPRSTSPSHPPSPTCLPRVPRRPSSPSDYNRSHT